MNITIGIILVLAILGWLWWLVEHAPEGFEDPETGFHYGRPEDPMAVLLRAYDDGEGHQP